MYFNFALTALLFSPLIWAIYPLFPLVVTFGIIAIAIASNEILSPTDIALVYALLFPTSYVLLNLLACVLQYYLAVSGFPWDKSLAMGGLAGAILLSQWAWTTFLAHAVSPVISLFSKLISETTRAL